MNELFLMGARFREHESKIGKNDGSKKVLLFSYNQVIKKRFKMFPESILINSYLFFKYHEYC